MCFQGGVDDGSDFGVAAASVCDEIFQRNHRPGLAFNHDPIHCAHVGNAIVLGRSVIDDHVRTKHLFTLIEHAVHNSKMRWCGIVRNDAVHLVKGDVRLPNALTKPDFHVTISQASSFHRFSG